MTCLMGQKIRSRICLHKDGNTIMLPEDCGYQPYEETIDCDMDTCDSKNLRYIFFIEKLHSISSV